MRIFLGLYFIAVAATMIGWLAGPLIGLIPGPAFLVLFIVQTALGGALLAGAGKK